jgi:hypothetical protein
VFLMIYDYDGGSIEIEFQNFGSVDMNIGVNRASLIRIVNVKSYVNRRSADIL